MIHKTIKLAPSDFAFAYQDCKRCFYLKATKGIFSPSKPMATIFTKIDQQEKKAFQDIKLNTVAYGFPKGKIVESDVYVKSNYIEYPDLNYQHYIQGQLDSLLLLDNGTYAIIDFKTSDTHKHKHLYQKQLHAYAYALQNPMLGSALLDAPITRLGLVIFNPNKGFEANKKEAIATLRGEFKWEELSYRPNKFITFMREVAELLSQNVLPDINPTCPYCKRDLLINSNNTTKKQIRQYLATNVE